jgi:translation initiation factor IF-2
MEQTKGKTTVSTRPPIVAVLGHVDHGKTTLLDYIRHTTVAAGEHGGITQHIGAYQILHKTHPITFIDTPGHEAFMKMRARGAQVADIAILVVAADDSVKPQTKESIRIIKEASIPMIVAVNKIDLPQINTDKIKQDLARNEVQVEGFGGDVPIVFLSAKIGTGVSELLDTIIHLASTLSLPDSPNNPLEAVVIETHVDKGKGMVASVLVKSGTLQPGMALYESDKEVAKVRALFNERRESVKTALPGSPVEVLGFTSLPSIGSLLKQEKEMKPTTSAAQSPKKIMGIEDFLSFKPEEKSLNVIIKADTAGSLEAVIASLEAGAVIVSKGVGDINDADILLAKSTGAFVIGFNTKISGESKKLAETEGVIVRTYTIIYELLDEVNEAISGMQEVLTKERELGKGTIIAEFPFDGKRIAGTKIIEGRIARGDQVKIMRNEAEIARAKVKSLRRGKEETTKAEMGIECGILFDGIVDFQINDAIIAFVRS